MKTFDLYWETLKIGTLTETNWDMRSSGNIVYAFDYLSDSPTNVHLADFIKHSIKTFQYLEDGDEENYLKMCAFEEANFMDFVDNHNWRIEDSKGESIKILCPIFHDNNQITWQED